MHTLKQTLKSLDWRLVLVQGGIVLTFAMIPLWYRFPTRTPNGVFIPPPLGFTNFYVCYFVILIPIVFSIAAWLLTGLPGFKAFRHDWRRSMFALALLSLAIWGYASQGWAWERIRHPEVAQNAGLQFCVVALFVVVAASAAPPARVIVTVMVFSLVWNTIITVLQMNNQGPVGLQFLGEFPIGPDQQGISIIQSGTTRLMRPYSLLPHPNILGGILAVYLLATVGWILSSEQWKRWAGIILFAAGLWALLLTFSRSAWLGLVAGTFTMLPLLIKRWSQTQTIETQNVIILHWRRFLGFFRQQRALILTALLSFVTAILFLSAYQPFLRARVGEGQESVELRSVSDRMVFLEFAHRSIQQQPMIGVGVGNFPWRIVPFIRAARYDMRGDNAHHVLLSTLAELGLVGFGLMVAALVFGTESVLTSIGNTQASNNDSTARIVLFGGFMALTFIGLLDHYPYTLLQFQTVWWGLLAVAMKSHGDRTSTVGST